MEKKWYLSKTIWIALLQLLVGFIGALIALLQTGDFTLFAGSIGLVLKSVVDFYLRFATTKTLV